MAVGCVGLGFVHPSSVSSNQACTHGRSSVLIPFRPAAPASTLPSSPRLLPSTPPRQVPSLLRVLASTSWMRNACRLPLGQFSSLLRGSSGQHNPTCSPSLRQVSLTEYCDNVCLILYSLHRPWKLYRVVFVVDKEIKGHHRFLHISSRHPYPIL